MVFAGLKKNMTGTKEMKEEKVTKLAGVSQGQIRAQHAQVFG